MIAETKPIWYTLYKVRKFHVKRKIKNETRKNFRQTF